MSIRKSDARFMLLLKFGGDEGDRTPYLLNAIQALSQVSYTPKTFVILAYFIRKIKYYFKKYSIF